MAITGVYKITNIVTNQIYIGSSIKITQRFKEHLKYLRGNYHHSGKLQNSFNKYGEENFKFDVLEECSKEVYLQREQHFIDILDPFFNICKVAGNCTGRKFSEETKKKMSLAKKGKPLNPALLLNQLPKCPADLSTGERYCSGCKTFTLNINKYKKNHRCRNCKKKAAPKKRVALKQKILNKRLVSTKVTNVTKGISFYGIMDACRFFSMGTFNKSGLKLAIKNNRTYYGDYWEYA